MLNSSQSLLFSPSAQIADQAVMSSGSAENSAGGVFLIDGAEGADEKIESFGVVLDRFTDRGLVVEDEDIAVDVGSGDSDELVDAFLNGNLAGQMNDGFRDDAMPEENVFGLELLAGGRVADRPYSEEKFPEADGENPEVGVWMRQTGVPVGVNIDPAGGGGGTGVSVDGVLDRAGGGSRDVPANSMGTGSMSANEVNAHISGEVRNTEMAVKTSVDQGVLEGGDADKSDMNVDAKDGEQREFVADVGKEVAAGAGAKNFSNAGFVKVDGHLEGSTTKAGLELIDDRNAGENAGSFSDSESTADIENGGADGVMRISEFSSVLNGSDDRVKDESVSVTRGVVPKKAMDFGEGVRGMDGAARDGSGDNAADADTGARHESAMRFESAGDLVVDVEKGQDRKEFRIKADNDIELRTADSGVKSELRLDQPARLARGFEHAGVSETLTRVERLQDVVNRFDEHFVRLASGKGSSLTINLNPPSLGRITMSCSERPEGLVVEMVADTRYARSFLSDQESVIRQIVENGGYKMSQFDVRSQNDGAEGRFMNYDRQEQRSSWAGRKMFTRGSDSGIQDELEDVRSYYQDANILFVA